MHFNSQKTFMHRYFTNGLVVAERTSGAVEFRSTRLSTHGLHFVLVQ